MCLVAKCRTVVGATLVTRLDPRALHQCRRPSPRTRRRGPGRKLLTVVHAMVAGGTHIEDADVLRSGATSLGSVAPSHGAVGARDVLVRLPVRSCPPTGRSARRGAWSGLVPRGRTSPWRSVRTRLFSVSGRWSVVREPQPCAPHLSGSGPMLPRALNFLRCLPPVTL